MRKDHTEDYSFVDESATMLVAKSRDLLGRSAKGTDVFSNFKLQDAVDWAWSGKILLRLRFS